MKCPHCGRTWDDPDFIREGLSPTVVLHEHVHRFCPGSPMGPEQVAVPRGARPIPVVARGRPLLRS